MRKAREKLLLIYQDCPMCGKRRDWGAEQIRAAKASDYGILKLSFVSPEAKGLITKAVKAGMTTLPFFTDGIHFAKDVEGVLKQQKEDSDGDTLATEAESRS